jgi:hypothetical protein
MAKITSVRIVPTKYGTFSLHYTNPDGRRRRLSVGPDYQLVQRQSVKFTDWLLEGKDPEIEILKARNNETAQAITVKELFPDFMSRHGTHKSTNMQISYRNSFKNICRCPEIADSSIGAVTLAMVLDYLHVRMEADKVTPATVNREDAMEENEDAYDSFKSELQDDFVNFIREWRERVLDTFEKQKYGVK